MQRSLFLPWQRWMAARTPAAEVLRARTGDGVELAIYRVPPRGSGKGAVMLLHGLASNRFSFHFPGRSLAAYLAACGFDCYIPELRGSGASHLPHLRWDLHDYLLQDVPAVLDRIRRTSGGEQVHWVGHSMGGILLLLHAMRGEGKGLGRSIALASALDYRAGSVFASLLKLKPVLQHIEYIPFGELTHLLSPLSGRVPRLDELNFAPGSTEPEVIRLLQANVFGRIPMSLLASLASLLSVDGVVDRELGFKYREATDRLKTPVLFIGGDRDVQCPLRTVEQTAALFPQYAQVEGFGRSFGHAQNYGHFCLLVGRRAPDEVWPRIARWLG